MFFFFTYGEHKKIAEFKHIYFDATVLFLDSVYRMFTQLSLIIIKII